MNEPCATGTIQQAHVNASGILVICRLTSDEWQGARQSCHMSDGNLRLTRQVPKGCRNGGEAGMAQMA